MDPPAEAGGCGAAPVETARPVVPCMDPYFTAIDVSRCVGHRTRGVSARADGPSW